MSKTNENKDVPSLHKTIGIENKSAKCKLSYGGSEMFTQIKRKGLPESSLKKKKKLKWKSFEPVMSDGEEAEGVKHMKTLKQDSFEPVILDDEEAEEVEQVEEGDFLEHTNNTDGNVPII